MLFKPNFKDERKRGMVGDQLQPINISFLALLGSH